MGRGWRILAVALGVVAWLVWERGIPTDTETDILRDPLQRVVFRMSQLEYAALAYWRQYGHPPGTLGDLVAHSGAAAAYQADPWEAPFRLQVRDSLLIIESRGPDGVDRSADDVVQISSLHSTWLGQGSVEAAMQNRIR